VDIESVTMLIATSYGMIRPWQDSDADALARHANNRNIWINLRDGFHHPYTLEHAHAFLEMVRRQDPVTFFSIATPREAIGGIGISLNQDVHRLTAELGYWLAEPYWGKGIMTETILKFTDYAFARHGLVRIYAEPYAYNAGSFRVLEKAGFVLEGRMRSSVIKDGKITDQLLYARIRDDPR
jgi:ribosomal-protein-alanine N-acetyltransferase